MAIAFSQAPIVAASIDGETSSALRAGIHSALTAAGWESEAVTDGYQYTLASPQSTGAGELQAKCRVRDIGQTVLSTPCVTVQFLSYDEGRLGFEHPVAVLAGRTYELIAGACQMFLALPGYSSDPHESVYAHAVCGGIPYVPKNLTGECALEGIAQSVSEAWWSSGVSAHNALAFRSAWYHDEGGRWSACYNGDLAGSETAAYQPENRLALKAVSHPDWDLGIFLSNQQTQWMDESPLYFDPLLTWGTGVDAANGLARIRGQIWDAMLGSKDAPLGHELTAGGFTWRNWMHYQGGMSAGAPGSYYSSLYLLEPAVVEGASNYAY